MVVGMVGLGKLGMPVAVAIELKGHTVIGYDLNHDRMQKNFPHLEAGYNGRDFQTLLSESNIKFANFSAVVHFSDIIFVAVQTPHHERFDGTYRLPADRMDFDYSFLKAALIDIQHLCGYYRKSVIVSVISTVLPGTLNGEIFPILRARPNFELMHIVYNPFFIAMGTVVRDFLNPEFVLLGMDSPDGPGWPGVADELINFYADLTQAPVRLMSIASAELTKVAYNTFITSKICIANTMMEIAHHIPGCNVDDVMTALQSATDRIVSPRYMAAGMGDGGGCHPRDNIALSALARKLDLSYDWFENLIQTRERQAEFLCRLMCEFDLPKFILGTAFKPETNLEDGSPALLCKKILLEWGHTVIDYDPRVDSWEMELDGPYVFLIGTKHEVLKSYVFPSGSVVIDPFRYLPSQAGVRMIRVGIG